MGEGLGRSAFLLAAVFTQQLTTRQQRNSSTGGDLTCQEVTNHMRQQDMCSMGADQAAASEAERPGKKPHRQEERKCIPGGGGRERTPTQTEQGHSWGSEGARLHERNREVAEGAMRGESRTLNWKEFVESLDCQNQSLEFLH